jgi:hypothetical protein
VTYVKDLGWLLLGGLLVPVLMAVGLAAVVFIVGRHLYWWLRGNTTPTSRPLMVAPK